MEQYYSNFKCYNADKQRYSLFAREKDKKIEVFMLKASKKEKFSKELARFIYDLYLKGWMENGIISILDVKNNYSEKEEKSSVDVEKHFHPQIVLVPIEEGDSPKFTFIKFCQNNFYRKETILVAFEQDILSKHSSNEEIIKIGKPREYKMI